MATKVEITSSLTSRTAQGGLGDVKSPRSHLSPLSDASNKSNDSSLSCSLLIEESNTTSNKFVNRFNPGTRPRVSPKPFSRERTSEPRKFSILAPKLLSDEKLSNDVTPVTSINTFSLDSGKNEYGRPSYTSFKSSLQQKSEKDQSIKPEVYSGRKLYSSTWVPGTQNIEELKTTSRPDEWNASNKHEVSGKPQVAPKTLELSQPKDTFHASTCKITSTDEIVEQKDMCLDEKSKNTLINIHSEDTASLRAQLRPKRRPVSAMFLNSINDSSTDNQVAKDEKPLVRKPRPLSVDLTAKFEAIDSSVSKKGNSSDELKENIPLRKNSFNTSILEEKAELGNKERNVTIHSEVFGKVIDTDVHINEANRGSQSGNLYSGFSDKESEHNNGKGRRFNREHVLSGVGENHTPKKSEENYIQASRSSAREERFVSDNHVHGTNDLSNSDESRIAPGMIRRRIGMLLDTTEPYEAKDDKGSPAALQKAKALTTDNVDIYPERPRTSSQSRPLPSEIAKMFSSSPPKVEKRSEKPIEIQNITVTKDYANLKEKVNLSTRELLEEKPTWTSKSFMHFDEKFDEGENATKGRKMFMSKDKKMFDLTAGITEGQNKNVLSPEMSLKTVRATVFEHNVERHSAATIYSTVDSKLNQPIKSETLSEAVESKKDYHNLADRFDGVANPKHSSFKDNIESDVWMTDRVGKAPSFIERTNTKGDIKENVDRHVPISIKNTTDNLPRHRIEPRFEITQTVGERALSESIKVVPEDKAVTLRSRRSFHSKEKEQDTNEFDDNPLGRSWSKLQRSKSEYRKRTTTGNVQEPSVNKPLSQNFDIQLDKKYSFKSERSLSMKSVIDNKPERTHQANRMKTTDGNADGEVKFDLFNPNIPRGKYTFELESQEKSDKIKRSTVDSKFGELDKLSLTEDKTSTRKTIEKERSTKFNQSSMSFAKEFTETEKNIFVSEDSTAFMKSMLNKEIEQMKKDFTPSISPSKEADYFRGDERVFGHSTSDDRLSRGRSFLDGRDASINVDYLTSSKEARELFVDEQEPKERRNVGLTMIDPMHSPTLTDLSPSNTKATYFAVTYMDNKKDNVEKEFGNYRAITSVLEDFPLKTKVRFDNQYVALQKDSIPDESYIPKEDFEKSGAPKTSQTYRSQNFMEEDILEKSNERTSEKIRPSVIDIDDVLRKFNESPNIENKGTTYRDSHVKFPVKNLEERPENLGEGQINLTPHEAKGMYKSTAVDIDALMVDYRTGKAKEKKASDVADFEDQGLFRWERSRSFRNSVEKGPKSKWIEPNIKVIDFDEGHQYKPTASWPSTYEANLHLDLKEDDDKFKYQKDSDELYSSDQNYRKKSGKTKEDQAIHAHYEKSQNRVSVDSLLSRQSRLERRSPSRVTQDTAEVTTRKSMRNNVSEMSVDDQGTNVYKQTERILNTVEQRQSHTERRPAKTSDILNLMLENKDRTRRRHARESLPAESIEQPKSQTTSSHKEWMHSEKKEYSERELSRHRPITLHESELRRERRSRSQHREKLVEPQQDQVKQCFSRSSTTNKDTDSLVAEPDRRYGTWGQEQQQGEDSFVHDSPSFETITSRKQPPHSRLSSLSHTETDQHDSITDAHDASLDRSSMDMDSTDGTESTPSFHDAKAVDFSFIDQTSVLDSTALKNRVQLSRKSQRRAPSQTQRKSRLFQSSSQLTVIEDSDSAWMYTDSTEDKHEKKEESDEEEKPQRISVQPQRMPMFPGMDHSVLMAQLRKRQEPESSSETQPQPSKSPKSPLPQGTLGIKLLPTSTDKQDRGADESPQWLKELKSKKRQSQYENHT
ncbi:Hypothetical predicted protein [Pelobates cultripes]|uniref:Tankyrase 1-binding protein C-terminal domain-containing protein n=1 Tax=Pelobates cultripes TaxID=61616 RepID=A0AAD1SBK1_PELCU|nr:Hypothetical predicted protein [Pelobates cultripes]